MQYEKCDGQRQVLALSKVCQDEVKVIFDRQSGLYWEAKSLASATINFYQRKMSWEEFNIDYIQQLNEENYGGYNDWRVPDKYELRSLISYKKIAPAFAQSVFEGIVPDDYWCGQSYGIRPDCGWVINFNLGAATTKNKSLKSYGLAVRGEKKLQSVERFIDNGDGTITDKVLRLVWQKKQNERKSYNDVQKMLKDYEFAGALDWRLPTVHELNSIFDESYANQSWYFDEFFEHDVLQPPILQHITANLFEDTYVWVTNFNVGYDGYYAEKDMALCYRLVRTLDDEGQGVFKMPSSGQQEKFSAEGFIIDVVPENTACSFGETDFYVRDMYTGLIYEKYSEKKQFTYAEAKEHIKELNKEFFGGYNNWRLPLVDELRFIANYSGKTLAVFDAFESYVQSDFYWTGEEHPLYDDARTWAIYFGYGCAIPLQQMQKCGCIAVCSGYMNLSDKEDRRYIVQNGCVIDQYTNLMWLQEELPLLSVQEAESYFVHKEIAGQTGWRIPALKELSTIIQRTEPQGQWYNKKLFPDIYDGPGMFLLAQETFNGMFNWGVNIKFAYDGYYADRLNGKYRVKAVKTMR